MNDAAAAPARYHVITSPSRILGEKDVEAPRSYRTREAAETECNRLNSGAGSSRYITTSE